MAIRLHVNVDHVATLRNARGTPYPDPVQAAAECLAAGADGITIHLREDRRHIVDSDVERMRAAVHATLNLEMAATDEMVGIARRVRPDVVTLVPERREERTTEGGLDAVGGGKALAGRIEALREAGLKVSLFIAADVHQIGAAADLGAQQIELHTGEYANAKEDEARRELGRLADGARLGRARKLEIAAGHGLTQANVVALMRIPEIVELNIGHAVVADALFLSLRGAVAAMRRAIEQGVVERKA